MKRKERPEIIPCAGCKHWPLVAPGVKVRCNTRGCVNERKRFASVDEWNEHQRLMFVVAVRICREMGLVTHE